MRQRIFLATALIILTAVDIYAQSTFTQVHQLLQTNCSHSGCHDGTEASRFNVNLSEADFYNSIINAAPDNSFAAAKYNKLVVPGDVQRSFLLRKIARGISDGLLLTLEEGADMPKDLPALADHEIELVRQWIMMGAPLTGEVVDTSLINSYYRDGGIDETYSPHLPPPPGEGFQIYAGRVFMPPNAETEYFLKYDPHLTAPMEGIRVETMMPDYMHHFVLYSFMPGADVNYRVGLRPLSENSMESVYNAIGTAAGLWKYELPQGTAYFFDQDIMFDVNTHCINSKLSIVSADLYINVYVEPLGTADDYMFIRNFVNESISIPQDNQPYTFTSAAFDNTETKTWKLWKLYTHTHKYGKKFDVFLRNPDGTKGTWLYDGNFSYEENYPVGYYRWGIDVTFRTWPDDALLEVDPRHGFIYEATFQNDGGPDPVNWGMTSNDEMMAMGFHFIYGSELSTGAVRIQKTGLSMNILPNPSSGQFMLSYKIKNPQPLRVDMFDLLGGRIATLVDGVQQAGIHNQTFRAADFGLQAGIYFLNIHAGGMKSTEKLVITD